MKRRVNFLLFVLILGVSLYFFFRNDSSTLKKEKSDFHTKLEENHDVTIEIKKENKNILLKRTEGNWLIVNSDTKSHSTVRPAAIDILMKTIADIEVKSPVLKKDEPGIKKKIKDTGYQVTIAVDKESIKTLWIYEDTVKQVNYASLNHYEEPFIVYIPGYSGLLSQIFRIDPYYWQSKFIFDFAVKNIKKIEVTEKKRKDKSFIISINTGFPKLLRASDQKELKVKNDALLYYINYFREIKFDQFISNNNEVIERFNNSPWDFTVVVTLKNNHSVQLQTYPMVKNTDTGKVTNPNECFGILNNKELVTFKYINIDLIQKNLDYFLQANN